MKKQEKLELKLKIIGTRLLDLVDGDPTTRGFYFWAHIRTMINSIKEVVTIETLCLGCNKIKPRTEGWKQKEVDAVDGGTFTDLVCSDCSANPPPKEI